jgi:hypothetical protein
VIQRAERRSSEAKSLVNMAAMKRGGAAAVTPEMLRFLITQAPPGRVVDRRSKCGEGVQCSCHSNDVPSFGCKSDPKGNPPK